MTHYWATAIPLALASSLFWSSWTQASPSSPLPTKSTASSPVPRRTSRVPKYLAEIGEKYKKAGSLQADFHQVTETAALKRRKSSSGVLMVQFPDKVRWETLKPDKNLLVSDGRRFWFYTPPFDEGEHGQVIEKKSGDAISKLASRLLSGAFEELSRTGDLVFRVLDPGNTTTRTYQAKPKPGSAGTVVEIRVGIDPSVKVVTRVDLIHKDGNRSEITLSKVKLGEEIDDEFFRFTAPPGTDRVSE